jgi:hypothetical protein
MAAASEHANQLKAMKATASAAALQRVEDEEPLQAKFAAIQRVEEEEPLQGKFSTAQRVEEDEPLQNKRMTAQRAEDEELLQGKFAPVQRVEEDELLQGKFDTVQRQEQIAAKPNNTGLPNQLKSGIESLSGMSMDHVKVHYNSSQPPNSTHSLTHKAAIFTSHRGRNNTYRMKPGMLFSRRRGA